MTGASSWRLRAAARTRWSPPHRRWARRARVCWWGRGRWRWSCGSARRTEGADLPLQSGAPTNDRGGEVAVLRPHRRHVGGPVQTTTIPATPEQAAIGRDRTGGLFTAELPADARIDGEWVTAPGATGEGAVVYVHGGGFQHTDPERERVLAYHFSAAARRPALRVEYRLAPEHPYPAALEDALAAYGEVLRRGIPAERVLFVGESAGATLILSMLLELKRTGRSLPGGAVAISPSTDLTLSSESLTANDGKDVISRAVLTTVAADYLGGADPAGAPQSPIHGKLGGLPPLLIAVGGDEILLDDARRFAAAADAAGVSVQLDVYEGMPHAFHLSAEAGTLLGRIGDWVEAPVREYPVSGPKAGPYAVASGPDGALWFTLVHEGGIGRRSAGGELSLYSVGAGPTVIAAGPDGAMWFSQYQDHRIGRIS
ncbi:alpha/beta hydrolase fold domain-containing protein, partial [Streptomyces sp. A7024]|nr:alpha/beta hydrolase fold domain-containing protein [Streptomyces coryli]